MSSLILPKKLIDLQEVEKDSRKKYCNALTPFKVANIIYEITVNHLLANDPEEMGYGFKQKYNIEKEKSSIFIDISNNWKADTAQKRPAIFIARQEAKLNSSQTLGQRINSNVQESENSYITRTEMNIAVICIAGPLGFAEEFADYVRQPFMYFSQIIENEYCFHKFRLAEITTPKLFGVDARDTFSIELIISTEFDDTWTIKGDDLKLRTVIPALSENGIPIKNQ
jgi:hypothetical protein